MGWTKRQYILQAFDEVGLASYVYDLNPAQLQSALYKLDSMMGTWNGKGIRIGYPLPSSPEKSDLDKETGVSDSANEAIFLNLAIRLAPSYGKTLSLDTKSSARSAYTELLARHTQPPLMSYPTTLPKGAGNKPWRYTYDPFIEPSAETIDNPYDSTLDLD